MANKMAVISLILGLLWAPVGYCSAQAYIRGKVVDKDANPIIAASVFIKGSQQNGTTSDLAGKFELQVPARFLKDTLVISFIGYHPRQIPIAGLLSEAEQTITLREQAKVLADVVIRNDRSLSEEFAIQKLDKLDIYMSPVADGDPLKAIAILPAATNFSETANVELRGSSANMSCVVLNRIPINKPVRNSQISGMGNFSLFNAEIIKSQNVYPGNPPLMYGASIAGLVEIETVDKVEHDNTSLSISLANIGLMIGNKLNEKNSLQVYGNYQFSAPYLWLNDDNISHLKKFGTKDAGLNFHSQLTPKLNLNVYEYLISEEYRANEYMYNTLAEANAGKNRWFQIINFNYKNPASAIILSFDSGIDVSRSTYEIDMLDYRMNEKFFYHSLSLKYFLNRLSLQGGVNHSHSSFASKGTSPLVSLDNGSQTMQIDEKIVNQSLESYVYARYNAGDFILSAGVRKNIPLGKQKDFLSYQASIRYNLNRQHSFILSSGNYNAYNIPGYNSLHFKLHTGRQCSFDYSLDLKNIYLKASMYAKHETTFDWLDEMSNNTNVKRNIAGFELYAEKQIGPFSFTGSYAWLDSRITIDKKKYTSPNDMDYIVKFSLQYRGKKGYGIGINYMTHEGLRYTPVNHAIYIADLDVYYPVYGDYNSQRNDPYHTIDLSLNKAFAMKKLNMTGIFYASATNILNRTNPCFPLYTKEYEPAGFSPYQKRLYYFGFQFIW